jgi:hypothetical protein
MQPAVSATVEMLSAENHIFLFLVPKDMGCRAYGVWVNFVTSKTTLKAIFIKI